MKGKKQGGLKPLFKKIKGFLKQDDYLNAIFLGLIMGGILIAIIFAIPNSTYSRLLNVFKKKEESKQTQGTDANKTNNSTKPVSIPKSDNTNTTNTSNNTQGTSTKATLPVFPRITSFYASPSTIYSSGGIFTVYWTTTNSTRATLSCTGLQTIVVSTNGSQRISKGRAYPPEIGCLLNIYSKDNVPDSMLIKIAVVDPPSETLGSCQYSPGPDATGNACKTYSECISLPGGTWIGTPCGN